MTRKAKEHERQRNARQRAKVIKAKKLNFRARKAIDNLPDEKDFGPEDWSHIRRDRKRLRERFAREYIKDFNGTAAMRRLGYNYKSMGIQAAEFLADPYTEWFLGQLLEQMDEKAIVTRNMVLAGLLKEANEHGFEGSHAARISAWRTLAKILGMEITKVEGNLNIGGGVMAVPFCGTLEDWENATRTAQAKLKQDVRK